MALRPDVEITVTAEKAVAGGRMLARHEGQVVFVANAIPGERVRARVARVSRQIAFAETVEVLEPSPDRRSDGADWACGGSAYAHIAYPRQLVLKTETIADTFSRIGKMSLDAAVPIAPSEEQGYRMRARMHARNGRFGFYREGTHELCDAESTRQLLPETIDAIGRLEALLDAHGIANAISCEIAENLAGSERAISVAVEQAPPIAPQIELPPGITGLLLGDRDDPSPGVLAGSPFVRDTFDVSGTPVELTRHVQSFFQANRYLVRLLVERVAAQVPKRPVVELYAGVGLFAVSLAALGWPDVVAVEGDRSSARDLETNAERYGAAISAQHTSVETFFRLTRMSRADTILLDPPRTGMSREALSGVLRLRPERIVYLSCDLATLARDVNRCVQAGYRLAHIEAFDLFPNTAHLETLVVLSKTADDR